MSQEQKANAHDKREPISAKDQLSHNDQLEELIIDGWAAVSVTDKKDP